MIPLLLLNLMEIIFSFNLKSPPARSAKGGGVIWNKKKTGKRQPGWMDGIVARRLMMDGIVARRT